MPQYDYDLFTIGAGSGGVRASRFAANYGAKVAIAEERYLGGTCVNVGCIPKKLLTYAAHYGEDFRDAEGYGWTLGERRFDWAKLIANKNKEIERLNKIYDRLLTNAGCTVIEDRATIEDPHTVRVGGKTCTAKYILVATGGWPRLPDIPGREHVITSNEAFFLDDLPKRVIIVGGGYIAVEFAGIFNGLGSQVTQLYRGPHFLRGYDDDIRTCLAAEMGKKGVEIVFNADIAKVEKTEKGLCAAMLDGTERYADVILYAIGRDPLTADLGLAEVGVDLAENGAVRVDDYFKTSVDSIYAIGDVIDRVQLTPVALAEGMAVAKTLFGGARTRMDYDNIPTVLFSNPNLGTVGLTEAQARERCEDVEIFINTFTPLRHTLSGNPEKTLMKLIVDKASDRVVGCHMVGPDAGEILQGIAIALNCGATKAQFDATIGIHPTSAEEFVTMREPLKSQR